jgi:hypothetical protein
VKEEAKGLGELKNVGAGKEERPECSAELAWKAVK